jgi:hypothetical protein
MIDRTGVAAATRRLRAASSELQDPDHAAEAAARMIYLWTWSVRQGRVLDDQDLAAVIWAFFIEHPGDIASRSGRGSRAP